MMRHLKYFKEDNSFDDNIISTPDGESIEVTDKELKELIEMGYVYPTESGEYIAEDDTMLSIRQITGKIKENYNNSLIRRNKINEGKHGRFEILGKNDDDEIPTVLGYATTPESAEDLVDDFVPDFDNVWYDDTYED